MVMMVMMVMLVMIVIMVMVVTNISTAFICNLDTWPSLFVRLLFDSDVDNGR